jgi:hypothetical protein
LSQCEPEKQKGETIAASPLCFKVRSYAGR